VFTVRLHHRSDPYVSITAFELDWHRHIARVSADWENTHPDR